MAPERIEVSRDDFFNELRTLRMLFIWIERPMNREGRDLISNAGRGQIQSFLNGRSPIGRLSFLTSSRASFTGLAFYFGTLHVSQV